MPTWGQILEELHQSPTAGGTPDFDGVRRKYLAQLAGYTGRNTIVYASDFVTGGGDPNAVTINLGDMQALMEVVRDLHPPDLDLVLHTPGGSPEALESLVRYLRTRFDHIRAFVPLAAMSAGTMWALACDEIIMGQHSQLGPIDPQFPLAFGEQIRLAPAQAVLDQFDFAQEQCARDPGKLAGWVTVLRSYGPSLLMECRRAQGLSQALVSQWLAAYMFRGDADAQQKSEAVAKAFADYTLHQSHSRPIDRDLARSYGVRVMDLEADQRLQDAVLSVHHATMHTLNGTAAAKVIENHLGRTYVVLSQTLRMIPQSQPPTPPASQPPNPSQARPNRQQRRSGQRGRR